jgi:hypothetical protein
MSWTNWSWNAVAAALAALIVDPSPFDVQIPASR